MTYGETDLAATIEQLSGTPLAHLTPRQLDLFDQFHAGGPQAVERLLPNLGIERGMTVLDVGSGFGGPARQIARSVECDVVGVDVTAAYVEVARALTDVAGLSQRVRFVCADIAALADTEFDAAYTIHVQMNVADKKAFYAEIADRLRCDGRLVVFEVCRNGDAEPALPLPWSLDGSDSFLVTADELRNTIEACGLTVQEWVDDTDWVQGWFEQAATRLAAAPGQGVTLPALLTDGPMRMFNYAAAIANGVVSIQRGTFVRARS
jgi:ubiquinone/menaquinone biosynthesis C-methylase UbiE